MTIVAISREMGSGGYEIGAAVAKALNFEYVDRQILLQAAHSHGVPEDKIADVAQGFSKPGYFHPRPSFGGNGYDPTNTNGSQLGPTNQKLIDRVFGDSLEQGVDHGGCRVHATLRNDLRHSSRRPSPRCGSPPRR